MPKTLPRILKPETKERIKRKARHVKTRVKHEAVGACDWAVGGTVGIVAFEHYGLIIGFVTGGVVHIFVIAVWAFFLESEYDEQRDG